MHTLQSVFAFLLTFVMTVFTVGQVQSGTPADTSSGFPIAGKTWTRQYDALVEEAGLPFAITFERSGGAGEDTHFYRGSTAQGIGIMVMTRPYEETIRHVQVSMPVPEDAAERAAALDTFGTILGPCLQASAADITPEEIQAFQAEAAEALSGTQPAILRAHGLQFIAQVSGSESEHFPPAYTLLVTRAPAYDVIDGQPAFTGWQTDVWTLLNARGTGHQGWEDIDVSGHPMQGTIRMILTIPGSHSFIVAFTDTRAPYCILTTQTTSSAKGTKVEMEAELENFFSLAKDMMRYTVPSLSEDAMETLLNPTREALAALAVGEVPEEEVFTSLEETGADVRFHLQSIAQYEEDDVYIKCILYTDYGDWNR